MDVLRIVGGVLGCINALVNLLKESKGLSSALAVGLDFVKRDLEMIKGHFKGKEGLHLQPQMQLQLQELAYEIDDFVHGLCMPGSCGGFILSAAGLDIRDQHIRRIDYFKSCAKDLENKLEKSSAQMKGGDSPTPHGCSASGVCFAEKKKEHLVGIGKPKKEIADLLSPPHGPLRVISIVGCSGLGKTALTKAIYEDEDVVNKFDHKAWVVASDHSSADNLNKILQELKMPPAAESTSEGSEQFPHNKRYLFVLDDVQQGGIVWENIKEAFCENNMGSRIILTTRAPSVATACSPGTYMYTMQCLGEKESNELLWIKAKNCPEAPANLAKGSKEIILKCGGLPLALIGAGEYLSVKGLALKSDHCVDLGKKLGEHLADDGKLAFPEMKRALVQRYDKLTNHDQRNCLLYLSIFPRGHQINSKNLIRKLIAEELVGTNGRICLDELINQGMIEEVLCLDDSDVAVERCKAHSIVLEFTIKKAVSRNIVSLIYNDKLQHNPDGRIRRLTLQSSRKIARVGRNEEDELSSLRSLTIFDSEILPFECCKMMRVLDLEGCSWRDKKVVDHICELVFLKYLSLRNTGITTLPQAIKKLRFLETLDIRDTCVNILPSEVIVLPQLAFLYGKFELPKIPPSHSHRVWLEKFLQQKSKLETLAGIVINKTEDFKIIILHARQLKKVKIWFKVFKVEPSQTSTVEETNTRLAGILISSIQKRFEKFESLSIHFNWSKNQTKIKDFLGSMHATCIISSIKLWGKLESLPKPNVLSELDNISKLHLFYTGLSIADLAVLQNLQCLEYLKIADTEVGKKACWDGEFVIHDNGFPCLHLLSLEAPKLPKVIFGERSMPVLNSLQLLCPESPVKVVDISKLASLNEVILHHSAPDATVDAWKDAATSHINRPFVRKRLISKKRKEPQTNI